MSTTGQNEDPDIWRSNHSEFGKGEMSPLHNGSRDTNCNFIGKSSKRTFSEVLPEVIGTDLCVKENCCLHHTDKYSYIRDDHLVIRRGEPFKIKLTVNRSLDMMKHTVILIFETGKNPLISDDTQVLVIVSQERFSDEGDWGAVLKPANDKEFTLFLLAPSTCIIGLWRLHIHISRRELFCRRPRTSSANTDDVQRPRTEDLVFTCSQKLSIYILFNPWCKDDVVHLRDEQLRGEYVLNDWGKIWRGTNDKKCPLVWNYGQFEENVLDASLYLLKTSDSCTTTHNDPVNVVKSVMKRIVSKSGTKSILRSKSLENSNNLMSDNGSWQKEVQISDNVDYEDWQGSPSIIEEWYKNRHCLPYTGCWVAAALLTTILRALGIPSRPVTGYMTSHPCGNTYVNIHIDSEGRYMRQMNSSLLSVYHVWTECWTERPEFPKSYSGWQAVDVTTHPETGPVSLHAIGRGEIGLQYNTASMFTMLNANVVYWFHNAPLNICQIISVEEYSVGSSISTRRPGRALNGNMDREDITLGYKNIHWSDQDKDKVLSSLKTSRSTKLIDKFKVTCRNNDDKDVTIRVDMGYCIIGQTFLINIFVKNNSSEHQTVRLKCRVHSVKRNGLLMFRIKKSDVSLELSPHQESIVSIKVDPSDYLDKLIDHQGLLRLSALYRTLQSQQIQFCEHDLFIFSPEIHITVNPPVLLGRPVKIRAHLTNPLPEDLTACRFIFEAPGFDKGRQIPVSDVPEKGSAEVWWATVPRRVGECCLLVTFNSHQIKNIHGYVFINVLSSDRGDNNSL